VIALRGGGRLNSKLAAVALIDLASGSRGLVGASLAVTVTVFAGFNTPCRCCWPARVAEFRRRTLARMRDAVVSTGAPIAPAVDDQQASGAPPALLLVFVQGGRLGCEVGAPVCP
jgi:hypothetical protein